MEFPRRTKNIMLNPEQYKVISREGKGAYSVVDKVMDPNTNKIYALKKVDH